MKIKAADVLANYFTQGYRFQKFAPPYPAECSKAVFLIHGWGVRAASMESLAHALADVDYTVFNYDYPSSQHIIAEHARIFLDLYRKTRTAEKITRKVLFVTHSMGGILLRAAMAMMTEAECRNIEAIVMLGPPNRGSVLASLGKSRLAQTLNASLKDMAPDPESFVNNIPPPLFLPPAGIIAGRFDGKVSFKNTALPDGQAFRRITVNCTHPGLRDPDNVLLHILDFFNKKDFSYL